jgi:predicted permease
MRMLLEWVQRLWGTVRGGRRDADLEQELRLHVELATEAAERRGDSSQTAARPARRSAGGLSQAMDALRDQRGLPWLDAVVADVVFGWRQLNRHRVATSAAILSLGLAIGATTGAFRLVDAVLLRPLPVAEPGQLFVVATTRTDPLGQPDYHDYFDYPTYREYANAVGDNADVMLVGGTARQLVTVGRDDEPEAAFRQFVSGNVFASLGLQPALGRLLVPSDDVTPGAHPVAVISYDYWSRRFGRDAAVIGKTFRAGNQHFEIVGVAPRGFTGTEPGSVTDLFVPAMMNVDALDDPGWSWFRIWLRPKAGITTEQVRQTLLVRFRADHDERLKDFPADTPKDRIDAYLREELDLLPAGSGVSGLQRTFGRPLVILAALGALVLLIACANVANLLTAQAMARTREMALRVSIGAARWRLMQLVLIESALVAVFASAMGGLFASWSARLVVSMLSTVERPVWLLLDADWRVLGFGVALAVTVTILLGCAPALRASSVKPLGALKGSEDLHAHGGLTNVLMAVQMAFCVFVLFAAALFVATFEGLVNRPLGFAHQSLVLLETESRTAHAPHTWVQMADHLRQIPGVEAAAMAGWAPLTANRWTGDVRVPGGRVGARPPYFVDVSSGYFDTMRIWILHGRDFRSGDAPPRVDEQQQPLPGVCIVNEAFARVYFDGQNPVGKRVNRRPTKDVEAPMEIVGLVRDAAYFSVREAMHPTVYLPVEAREGGTLIVRTAGDPLALAPVLRREVSRARPDVRVRAVEPQSAFVRQQMLRERLLATLSTFFALVALLLAGIGLYGVLNYAVIRQRREIGIRMALGARAPHVVRRVTIPMVRMVGVGSVIGLAGGLAFGRVVEALLFQVRPTNPASLMVPLLALGAVATLAALPPVFRAVRIDPAQTLRSE